MNKMLLITDILQELYNLLVVSGNNVIILSSKLYYIDSRYRF